MLMMSSVACSQMPEGSNISIDFLAGGEESSSAFDSDSELNDLQDNLQHLSLRKKTSYRKAISNRPPSHVGHSRHTETKRRELRSSIDWTENAYFGDHIWLNTHASGDFCYLVDSPECLKTGPRKKCAGCRIVAHVTCIALLEKRNIRCKPSFCEACPRTYRENTFMHHRWMQRRREDSKCQKCSKSFPQRFSFQSKEVIAISCCWCKVAYHLACFEKDFLEEKCSLGILSDIIVPPFWIIKLAKKGSFKSSIRKKRRTSVKKRDGSKEEHSRTFIVKPIPLNHLKPVIVFINPKSGGNQGLNLLHKFQWLLNPRQVFDLSLSGPRFGLELYKKAPNVRILACGGDGTVGWILSHIDSLGVTPHPPVAILPLGTGNDLSRTLNWGGSYSDEPLSKVLLGVEEGSVVQLDRWNIEVSPYPVSYDTTQPPTEETGLTNLPLDVMNNYFSLGADAHVTLEFHESREANPARFSSRFRNKMFYAGVGGKDLLRRSWKDLSEHICLECDGQDFTPKIRDTKFHCLLFLNIPRYAAGTTPWGNPSPTSFEPQRLDDGYLEVIGFTAASLAGLQIGAHGGMRLTQCKSVCLRTVKTIPMQVDGEPCRLQPSVIKIRLRNQANMILKPKRINSTLSPLNDQVSQHSMPEQLHYKVHWLPLSDYESLHYDRAEICRASVFFGGIVIESDSPLEQVRCQIESLRGAISESSMNLSCPSLNWCFVDSITADHFFQIDRKQESSHYIMDIASEVLYILDLNNSSSSLSSHNGRSAFTHQTLNAPPHPHHHDVNDDVLTKTDFDSSSSRTELFLMPPPHNLPYIYPEISKPTDGTSHLRHDRGKVTMFLEASWQGIFDKVVECHQNGIDLLTTDKYGMTGLHYASMNDHKDVVCYFIEKAPSVILDMTDFRKGQTALHMAAWLQMRTICTMLVKAGASLTITDFQGNTASQLAFMANDQELGAYLQCHQYSKPLALHKVHETAI